MKKTLILLLALLIIPTAFAAIEYQGKCNEIGFEQNQTHCILPDGSACVLGEFTEGTCGEEYQKDFCVEKGQGVWWKQGFECCEGLEPYFPPERGVGQEYCEDISNLPEPEVIVEEEIEEPEEEIKPDPIGKAIVIGSLIILGFIIWLIIKRFRK